jgi:filamentous hemagglutinin
VSITDGFGNVVGTYNHQIFSAGMQAAGATAGALDVGAATAIGGYALQALTEAEAPLSLYDTSGGMKGINTDVTAGEFSSTLQSNGYTATNSLGGNGPVSVLQNGDSTYTIYTRTSTGSSGASYVGPAGQTAKFNLGN